MVMAPVIREQKGEFRDVIERLGREGFVRARVDGNLVEIAANTRIKLDPKTVHNIDVVVDRLVMDDKIRVRLSDSVETALKWGEGSLVTLHQEPGGWGFPIARRPDKWSVLDRGSVRDGGGAAERGPPDVDPLD
jgi:excinuclease UvrABC ATPase subunit